MKPKLYLEHLLNEAFASIVQVSIREITPALWLLARRDFRSHGHYPLLDLKPWRQQSDQSFPHSNEAGDKSYNPAHGTITVETIIKPILHNSHPAMMDGPLGT